jgi:inhibitor of cysteine peptidase
MENNNLFSKLSAMLLGVVMIATTLPTAFAMTERVEDFMPFTDVQPGAPFIEGIQYLKDAGVLEGYADGTFLPDNKINRAEFLKIVMEASDHGDLDGTNCYPDVKAQWFAPYVCGATELGLVKGYDDGRFRPEQEINFAEASKIVANALNLTVSPADGNNWFEPYVRALDNYYAVPDSVDAFDQALTRGEMAEMIWRVEEEPVEVEHNTYREIMDLVSAKQSDGQLVAFESCSAVEDYLDANTYHYDYYGDDDDDGDFEVTAVPSMIPDSVMEESVGDAAPQSKSAGSDEFSTTNVQVFGVDEADIVKNDGRYIYLIKGNTVRIVDAYPASKMKELDQVTFDDAFTPSEMYVDGNRLVVIGRTYDYYAWEDDGYAAVDGYISEPYWGSSQSKVYVLDMSDRNQVEVVRTLTFEGSYLTSRKVDDVVYLVSNKDVWSYDPDYPVMPLYEDSVLRETSPKPITGCEDVLYLPGGTNTNYTVVAGIPIDDDGEIFKEVILGSAGTVYSSRDNLYISETNYNWYGWDYEDADEKTIIHKFALEPNDIDYVMKGEVPGHLLNQFSMDESDGYFRVATTVGNVWDSGNKSKNNVYVLDSEMKTVGNIEGIAPGETIYSVRFMGDRAYMVTFKKVDPFFVIDLKNPRLPRILGKLKIPGYSDYLHPYGENHVIGFGKDAVEALEDEKTMRSLDFAWYQGMKVAMFDVTDVANPKELHKVSIGDRGTDSPLLWNHKALLFDAAKGLMAFPVTEYKILDSVKESTEYSADTYGDPVFQGAYVFDVSVENGFELKGKISHYEDDEVALKGGYYWYGEEDIERILYIGDYLYTISKAVVQANKMSNLDEVNEVELGL